MVHRRSHIFALLFVVFVPVLGFAQDSGTPAVHAELPSQSPLPDSQPTPGLECSEYVPPEERADAKRLALRGVACFEAQQYTIALRHYRRARELSDANLLNAAIGRTFQELGQPFIARRYYRDYLSGHIEQGEGRGKIEQRLAAVEEQLQEEAATVKVESSPPGADIYVVVDDGHREDLGRTPMAVQMLPGKRRFIVERDDFVPQTHDVNLSQGQTHTIDAALVSEDALMPVSGRSLQRAGIVTAVASAPFVVAGAALILVGKNKRAAGEELFGPEHDEQIAAGASMQQWGIVSTVVGLAGVGTGVTLYLVGRSDAASPDTAESAESESALRPEIYINPTELGVRARF